VHVGHQRDPKPVELGRPAGERQRDLGQPQPARDDDAGVQQRRRPDADECAPQASPVLAKATYDGGIVASGPTSPATASIVLSPSPVL